jgi:predicted extracellular nuclease
MRKLLTTVSSLLLCNIAAADTAVFINEIHYDNSGADSGEFVELAGPAGTDLNGWELVFYNGSSTQLKPYATASLSGVLSDDTGSGSGFLNVFQSGIQNGSPDGLALVDASGAVVQFLSYEGIFTAAEGVAAGMTSTDIGVSESSSTLIGDSMQLQGSGSLYSDFTWATGIAQTPGTLNAGQSINGSDTGSGDTSGGDDTALIPIYEIQDAGHSSPYEGQVVTTSGVITATDSNGIYVQDPLGDADDATSDAIFIYTGSGHGLLVGDAITIKGGITEYTPGGSSSGNLSITEFYRPEISVESSGNSLPAPSIIGRSGRVPPSQVIDDDQLTAFDPVNDGIDFYESLEGMLVTLEDAVAVSPTNRFGEIFALANQGADASGRNARSGITISPDDFNPERVQIDFDSGVLDDEVIVNTGDLLGDVTGVVGYSYGNFEIYPTESFFTESTGLTGEVSSLKREQERQLTIASYNLLNLDPNDDDGDSDLADGRFERIAAQIVDNLHSPAILALQEIQDNSGSTDDGIVDADVTLQLLVDAIAAAGGPSYRYIDNPPENNQDGGQPGANIRVAYLYNPELAEPHEVVRITDGDLSDGDAFAGSRKPLYVKFEAADTILHLVNNHLSSKGGSTPLMGQVQPPVNGSVDERVAQARAVNAFVNNILDQDPDAGVVVLGDLNEFQFKIPADELDPLAELKGADLPVLVNMTDSLPPSERYSYIYRGNSQALDHILLSHNLAEHASYDLVHVNSEFADYASDHDPALLKLNLQESDKAVRFASFNISFNRYNAGDLITDLSMPDNAQAQAVAEIIQRVRPDVVLLNEFDYDERGEAVKLFQRNYLKRGQNGAKGIRYRHVYLAPSNTGIPSGYDLDNDGSIGGPGDAQGFGFFPGQYGMVLLSRYPIAHKRVRTFQHFLWKDMPDSMLPSDWYDADEQAVLRLSSKSHWDIPVKVKGKTIHVLASHPTPPVFDGPEDRNGRRNHDEIRFWVDYIAGADYMVDDKGRAGGLSKRARFVVMGDLNADPNDGDSTGDPTLKLLASPMVNANITPVSAGAAEAAIRQGGVNLSHLSGAAFDTADFADGNPGNLRADYVLPSRNLCLNGAGVFWPQAGDPLFRLVGDYPFPSSDHRLVWIDIGKQRCHAKCGKKPL